ncbi:hypothetical protein [Kitasatospora cheerisanensis]|uniref:hypothetical protein n=1 Tax=Kitasatospora cheerisanensis TaxID=81942 RepID=UPI00055C77AE|nr:hypothetical protein [Kitasatospora cheerisanensis]
MLRDAVRGVVVVAAELAEEASRRVAGAAEELRKRTGELPSELEQLRSLAEQAVTAGVDLVTGLAKGRADQVFEKVGDQVVKVGVVLSFLESKLREVDEPEAAEPAASEPEAPRRRSRRSGRPPVRRACSTRGGTRSRWPTPARSRTPVRWRRARPGRRRPEAARGLAVRGEEGGRPQGHGGQAGGGEALGAAPGAGGRGRDDGDAADGGEEGRREEDRGAEAGRCGREGGGGQPVGAAARGGEEGRTGAEGRGEEDRDRAVRGEEDSGEEGTGQAARGG